jgi:hypothetical protein
MILTCFSFLMLLKFHGFLTLPSLYPWKRLLSPAYLMEETKQINSRKNLRAKPEYLQNLNADF